MAQTEQAPQEPRPELVGVRVTAHEKRAVRSVADIHGKTESDVMREQSMADILAEYDRIREAAAV